MILKTKAILKSRKKQLELSIGKEVRANKPKQSANKKKLPGTRTQVRSLVQQNTKQKISQYQRTNKIKARTAQPTDTTKELGIEQNQVSTFQRELQETWECTDGQSEQGTSTNQENQYNRLREKTILYKQK